jgi:uncharacterized membrane protein
MISTFVKSGIVFLILDGIYLTLMKNYFNKQIKLVQGSPIEMNIFATILCYLTLIFALNYYIIKPKMTPIDAFILGLVIYAVYEFTTNGLLKHWMWATVIMDTLWGGVLFALTTWIVRKFIKA